MSFFATFELLLNDHESGVHPCDSWFTIPHEASVMLADVLPHLMMPVRPFVSALRPPIVQMMINAAVPQNLRHSVRGPAVLPWATAGRKPDIAARVLVEEPRVALIRHVVHRVIEIEIVIVHPIHRIAHVVHSRKCVTAFHVVWMFKKSIGRMKGAKRCAQRGNPDAWRLAL